MADNQKKENFFKKTGSRIAANAKATKSEVKKISWPTRKQLINNTAIVIVCIAIVGVVIFALDSIFGLGFNFFISNERNVVETDPTEPFEIYSEGELEEPSELFTVDLSTELAE